MDVSTDFRSACCLFGYLMLLLDPVQNSVLFLTVSTNTGMFHHITHWTDSVENGLGCF